MLNEMFRSGSLLNVCSYLKSKRSEEYATALNESYNPSSGQMLVSLPVDTTLDMSSSTMDFDVGFTNGTPEVPLIIAIVQVGANTPQSGFFYIEYDGDVSGQIPFDATAEIVEGVLNNMHPINGRFYTVHAMGGPLPASPILVSFSGFNHDNQKIDDISAFASINNGMTTTNDVLTGSPCFYSISTQQNSVFSYPRCEKWFCPFSKASIVVNQKNVYDIQNFDVFYNILQLGRPTYARWDDVLVSSANDEGQGMLDGQTVIRMAISLEGIDLFKSIFPLNIFKGVKIQLQLNLQSPELCLIFPQDSSPSMSYTLSNIRLHYYAVELHESDVVAIQNVYNTSGVAIPFFNVSSFTDSVDTGVSNKNINFSPQASNVIGIWSAFLSNGYMGNPENFRKRSTFLANFLESYRVRLASYYFPSDVSKCSNQYFYSTDIWQEFKNLTELYYRASTQSDYMGGETFLYNVTSPTVRVYSTEQQRLINVNALLSTVTCDSGYNSTKRERCSISYYQGVDTSNSSTNYLQLTGMTVESPQTCFIFVVTQDALVFSPGKMVWNH